MGKQKKLKAAASAAMPQASVTPLMLGNHKMRVFEGLDAAFGARRADYPPMASIPDFPDRKTYEDIFQTLFFSGGKLDDFGLSIKPDLDRGQVMTAIRALMSSFDPQHEHKAATVAWALHSWTDGKPVHRRAA